MDDKNPKSEDFYYEAFDSQKNLKIETLDNFKTYEKFLYNKRKVNKNKINNIISENFNKKKTLKLNILHNQIIFLKIRKTRLLNIKK